MEFLFVVGLPAAYARTAAPLSASAGRNQLAAFFLRGQDLLQIGLATSNRRSASSAPLCCCRRIAECRSDILLRDPFLV